jgi:hypothetical protein
MTASARSRILKRSMKILQSTHCCVTLIVTVRWLSACSAAAQAVCKQENEVNGDAF